MKMAQLNHMFLLIIYLLWSVLVLTQSSIFDDKFSQKYRGFSDYISEDDHGEFELSDIITLAAQPSSTLVSPTAEERQENVDLHNAYRRNFTYPIPEVGDMIMLEHNNTLEFFAGEMLKRCIYNHVFAKTDNTTDVLGQSLYRGPSKQISRALYAFYEWEYRNYFFNNFTCLKPYPKYKCGHMLQVMWAQSEHVGFNRKFDCWPRTKVGIIVIHYIVGGLDYYPKYFPFRYGTPCSNCKPGYYCSANLCIPDHQRFCEAYGIDCECKLHCHNCGTPDLKNCKCACKLGWDWGSCQYPCQNNFEALIPHEFPPGSCNLSYSRGRCQRRNPDFRESYCRKSCRTCFDVVSGAEPDKLCCGGKKCDEYYVLNLDTCECTLLCPSFRCLYNTTTATTIAPKIQSVAITDITLQKATEKIKISDFIPTSQKPTAEKEPRPISIASTEIFNLNMILLIWIGFYLIL